MRSILLVLITRRDGGGLAAALGVPLDSITYHIPEPDEVAAAS